MSLIYQALKQNEQQAPVTAVVGVPAPAAPVVAAAVPTSAGWMQRALLPGAVLVAGGVLLGVLLGQRTASAPVAAAPAPATALAPTTPTPAAGPVAAVAVAAPAVTTTESPLPKALAVTPAATTLPRAEPPLPTAGPRLTLSTTLAPRPAAEATAAVPPAPAPAAAPVAAPRPASVEVSVRPVAAVPEAASTAGLDVAELFDGLNRALEARDEAAATRHIQAIRLRLPESALARMRAEGWYALRTGDLDKAQRVYRRLLEKLPGDENASLALASIERQEQRPDQARDILSKSLKANPGSAVLRTALDQSPNEASR